jgi:uncharacterized coiled-coil protein SlyX
MRISNRRNGNDTTLATHDAGVLLDAIAELPDSAAAEQRLLEELHNSIARQRAGLARTEATLAAVLEMIDARPE